MSSFVGFASAAIQLGYESILIKPTRGIYGPQTADGTVLADIVAHAVVEERHEDRLEVTEHPVEQGAAIADHAFKHPAEVTLRLGWSNSPTKQNGLLNLGLSAASTLSPAILAAADLAEIGISGQSLVNGSGADQINATYQKLLELQSTRALFVIYTAKRVYTNMVCRSLSVETDYKTANALFVNMTCKQVILVNTETRVLTKENQAQKEKTTSPIDRGGVSARPSGGPKR